MEGKKVVVAGAGIMGTGIAHAFAGAGFATALVDMSEDAVARARASIHKILDHGVRLGKLDDEAAAAAKSLLTVGTDIAAASDGSALFVETVSEKLDVKRSVIALAETTLPANALIASNTSALSITEIGRDCRDPGNVFGMHFFNPVHKMKLVELVRGLATRDEALVAGRDYCEAIGKVSITVSEAPGLTTSRMSAMMGNEAMYMLQEGVATAEDIDTAHRLGFNHPVGPLELGDITGWDTRLAVLRYLHQTLGEKFRPCPLIIKMVAAGRLGRKTGMGVYEYRGDAKVPGSGLRGSAL